MLADYGYIAILLIAAIAVPVLILVLAKFLAYKSKRPDPDDIKSSTYECGMETIGTSWVQFNFRYYFFALLFVVFIIWWFFGYTYVLEEHAETLFNTISSTSTTLLTI